jgi:polyhydroxyalkanoate synthase
VNHNTAPQHATLSGRAGDETMAKTAARRAAPAHDDPAQALGQALGDAWKSMSGLNLPAQALSALQGEYIDEATRLWNQALAVRGDDAGPPVLADRRFAAQDWAGNPAAAYLAQVYLLNARTLMRLADALEGDEKSKARIRFAVQQWTEAASPSNYLALNPEAQHKALQTQGESIAQGLQLLYDDLRRGRVSQTDESVFEVGRNVATSPGAVVFENELFQLLEYQPLTLQVHERPILFVPPCINKFYILDLQPDNSLIRYTVAQGHRVFVVSWRNPDETLAAKGWDDYIEDGVIRAITAVQAIGGVERISTLGFCVGGTLLATALAVLAARGQQPAASLTLLTTLLDFSDNGVLDLFIDEASVQLREATIGALAPQGPRLLKGQELATTFSLLRPNDLMWNYVVGNYLKGERPPPFDLLYWNSDSTNLPGPMYCWYLRHTYLQDDLKHPGRLTVCGVPLDLHRIQAPVYIYGSREDHIVPWTAAYRSVPLLAGPRRFVLGASGHIAGVVNPPQKKKRSHWVSAALPTHPEAWLHGAEERPGSWWTDWSAWLAPLAGKPVAAPKRPGNRAYKTIEPAPGRYVQHRA